MNATEFYESGNLKQAIEAQLAAVKEAPTDQAKRLFLFELAAFAGDLDRARRQIDALQYTDVERQAAAMNYRQLLEAEALRRRLFQDGVQPGFLTEPPEHVRLRLQAVEQLLRAGNHADAAATLIEVNAATPQIGGMLNSEPFDALRDCDDLFGSVLEVMAKGKYFWVPLETIDSLALPAPKFPRDLLWVPARLEMNEGASGEVFLPSLYPGSHEAQDDHLRLGRKTDWQEPEPGLVLGKGLRMFLVGDDAMSILEWRELQVGGLVDESP